MSNNKKSSVEWLINELQKSKDWQRVLNEISQMSSAKVDILAEAKAMHKEEIEKAYYISAKDTTWRLNQSAEQYYNEIYGGKDDQE